MQVYVVPTSSRCSQHAHYPTARRRSWCADATATNAASSTRNWIALVQRTSSCATLLVCIQLNLHVALPPNVQLGQFAPRAAAVLLAVGCLPALAVGLGLLVALGAGDFVTLGVADPNRAMRASRILAADCDLMRVELPCSPSGTPWSTHWGILREPCVAHGSCEDLVGTSDPVKTRFWCRILRAPFWILRHPRTQSPAPSPSSGTCCRMKARRSCGRMLRRAQHQPTAAQPRLRKFGP